MAVKLWFDLFQLFFWYHVLSPLPSPPTHTHTSALYQWSLLTLNIKHVFARFIVIIASIYIIFLVVVHVFFDVVIDFHEKTKYMYIIFETISSSFDFQRESKDTNSLPGLLWDQSYCCWWPISNRYLQRAAYHIWWRSYFWLQLCYGGEFSIIVFTCQCMDLFR